MHGIKTIHEINHAAVKTFEQEQAEKAAQLAAADKINALRSTSVTDEAYEEIQRKHAEQRRNAVARLGENTDEELISLVEGALLGGKLLPSTLEEELARRLCEKIGRDFLA